MYLKDFRLVRNCQTVGFLAAMTATPPMRTARPPQRSRSIMVSSCSFEV